MVKWRVLKVEGSDEQLRGQRENDKITAENGGWDGRGSVLERAKTTETYYGEAEPVFSPYAAQLRNEIRSVRRELASVEATAASMQKAVNAKQEEINALKLELDNARVRNVKMNLELGKMQHELNEAKKPPTWESILPWKPCVSDVERLDKRITDLAGRVVALEGYRATDQSQWAHESRRLERVIKWLKRGLTSEL